MRESREGGKRGCDGADDDDDDDKGEMEDIQCLNMHAPSASAHVKERSGRQRAQSSAASDAACDDEGEGLTTADRHVRASSKSGRCEWEKEGSSIAETRNATALALQ
jgi:hypothetical protein